MRYNTYRVNKLAKWIGSVGVSLFFVFFLGGGTPKVLAQNSRGDANTQVNDTMIGPHEAGNIPNIGGKVNGVPMVIMLYADSSIEQMISTIIRYSSATPKVLRITGVNDTTTTEDATALAQKLNQLVNITPQGTIVVYGNELNNLEVEWKNKNISVAAAGAKYAPLFTAFHNALDRNHFRSAPSPLDVYNSVYNWEEFYTPAASAYQRADVIVANAYEIPRIKKTAASAIADVEAKTGRSVVFLTEFGFDPEASLEEGVRFLRENDPPNGLQAATLVPNKCGDRAFKTDGSTQDPWLYYIKGEVFNKEGQKVVIGSGNECGGSTSYTTLDPVLIYPRLDKDQHLIQQSPDLTLEDTAWRRYLANTQVYCAPAQVFYRTNANTLDTTNGLPNCNEAGDLGPGGQTQLGDGRCQSTEFPVLDTKTELNISTLSFPLFRDEKGGISIEADLSRVDSSDTFFEAAKRNAKPEYAPQFYLTSPETQCLNAVRYANYVENVCETWYEPGGGAEQADSAEKNTPTDGRCGADIDVNLPDGSVRTVLDLKNEFLPNEGICKNYNVEVGDPDSRLAQAIRSIQPHTPRVYKMGFLVQHNFSYDDNLSLANQFNPDQKIHQKIINWFQGAVAETIPSLSQRPGEKIDIVPIWYHVGMAASKFDNFQAKRPYAINPDIPTETEFSSEETKQFTGGIFQTYNSVLQPEHQSFIETNVRNYVLGNNDLMKFMAHHFQTSGTRIASTKNVYFQNSDVARWSADPLGWTRNSYDTAIRSGSDKYHQFPMPCLHGEACFCFGNGDDEQCINQTYDEIKNGFPENFEASESYLNAMRRQIIYRINSGIQATHLYPQNIIDPHKDDVTWTDGSVSMRHFGGTQALCEIDQENIRQGWQEDVSEIESDAHQTRPNFISSIVANMRSKVLGWAGRDSLSTNTTYPGGPNEVDMLKNRVERTYLILPDDSIKIGVVQNILLRTFLPPETYVSLITGEHPLLPIREWYAEKGIISNGVIAALSAHLRVNGAVRTVDTESDGYLQVVPVQYEVTAEGCGSRVSDPGAIDRSTLPWVPKNPDPERAPSLENGCVALESLDESLVGIRGEIEGEEPDERPEAPGGPYALFEFVRRMAFTPLHMQSYKEYPGLEEFYLGGANARTAQSERERLANQTPKSCVYQPKEIDVREEFGYSSDLTNPALDPFRSEICNVSTSTGVPGEYLRSLLEIEASPFLRAVRGQGRGAYNPTSTSFLCTADRFGSVGPMNLVVSECSSEASTQGFSNAENSFNPDLCTISGSMTAAAALVRRHQSVVPRTTSNNAYSYYEALAERYLGVGACGELGVRDDGTPAYPGGPDYCAYVAERSVGKFRNYCSL